MTNNSSDGTISWKTAIGLALVFMAAHLTLGSLSVGRLAPTYDEAFHVAVGYSNFAAGEKWLDSTSDAPPGAREWAAIPLMLLRPAVFDKDSVRNSPYKLGDLLLHTDPGRPDRLLNICRLFMLWTLSPLLAWFLFRWAGELGGPFGAAAAVFCLAFSPFILANAALTTLDMALAASMFASVYLFRRALLSSSPRPWGAVCAGTALGLTLTVKYSAIVLLPALPLAGALYIYTAKTPQLWRRLVRTTAIVFCVAAVIIVLVCGLHGLPQYWKGLSAVLWKIGPGSWRPAYFMGQSSAEGFGWRYFALAFLLKTPVPFLLALALAVWALLKDKDAGKEIPGLAAFVFLPPALLFAAACSSKLQIGLRHVIAIYPFLFLIVGGGAARLVRGGRNTMKFGLGALAAWYIGAAVYIHPHYLAYFNELAGGPSKGYKYFVDSNLDWGQGLKELGDYVKKRGGPAIYLSYYGTADPHSYGIRYAPVAGFTEIPRAGKLK